MNHKFSGLKAKNYKFLGADGASRDVIAILAGGKRIGFIEYEDAYRFVNRVHDLCEQHERSAAAAAPALGEEVSS